MVSACSNASKSVILITWSFSGLVANSSIISIGAARPTGTHRTFACSCNLWAAALVFFWLIGFPSVITTTTELASCLPLTNSLSACPKATEVRVLAPGHSISLAVSANSSVSLVKWLTHVMPHWVSMSIAVPFPAWVHNSKSSQLGGPLKSWRATFTSVLFRPKAVINLLATIFVLFQPSSLRLALPSSKTTTSTLEIQLRVSLPVPSRILLHEKSLQSLNSNRSSLSASQHLPAPRFGDVTVLVRLCVPSPHCLEQLPQLLHSDNSQSASQDWILHASSSSVSSQGLPPCRASTSMERVLSKTPPPHSAEQDDQPPQSLSLQSTGQTWVLHCSTISKGGHSMPPPSGCVTTLRDFVIVPPPHVAEHSSLLHSDTSQSLMDVTGLPSIFKSSPRIFSKAHNSDFAVFWLSQHSCMVLV